MLRQHTRELHHELDHASSLCAMLRPGLTLEGYAAILRRYVAFYERTEPLLQRLEGYRPSALPAYRPRLAALQADLSRLPKTPPAAASETPLPSPKPETARGCYLGIRYVLEGSTQGAQVIAAQLARHLPQLTGECFAFWSLQREAAVDWQALAAMLAAPPRNREEGEAAVAAASAVFALLIELFLPADDADD